MSRRNQHRKGERGFAMLLVFVMAAAVALMLYRQMPRVAFESERDKEDLLIYRGSQYQRAIQLYYATFKRYPATLEDLENTNDHRFLRKRYLDPYTGKSEWRLIHTNGLNLTDSKVQAPPNPNGTGTGTASGNGTGNGSGSISTSTTSSPSTTNSGTQGAPAAVNAAVAARPSDRSLPGNQSYANPTGGGYNQTAQNNPPNYNDPAQFPPISLFPNGYNPSQPSQPGNGLQPIPNQPGLNQPGLNQPGLNQPGLNQPGLNQPGLNQPGLNQPGFNSNQPGFNSNQPGGGPPTLPAGLTPPSLPPGLVPPPAPGSQQPGGLNQAGLNQSGLNQPGIGQPAMGGAVPAFPSGVATSPDGSVQGQFSGQQYSVQQPPIQLPPVPPLPVQQPPVQQLPVQQQPVQQLPGQTAFPGQFNAANPGAAAAGTNPGLNIINQLLTTPRPPPSGIGATTATNNQTIGGGLAGVASKFTGATIKSYGGRTDYSEWEFVFQLPQQTGMPNGQPQNGQQQNGQQQNGQPQSFQPFPGPGGAGMPPPPTGPPPPPPPGGFPAIPSLPH